MQELIQLQGLTELKEVSLARVLRTMPVVKVAVLIGINHQSLQPTFKAAIQFDHDWLVAVPRNTAIVMEKE